MEKSQRTVAALGHTYADIQSQVQWDAGGGGVLSAGNIKWTGYKHVAFKRVNKTHHRGLFHSSMKMNFANKGSPISLCDIQKLYISAQTKYFKI